MLYDEGVLMDKTLKNIKRRQVFDSVASKELVSVADLGQRFRANAETTCGKDRLKADRDCQDRKGCLCV